MSKISINELARVLEDKPQKIIDVLPELGVSEKKTRPRSIDEDVAVLLKRHFGIDSPEPRPSTGSDEFPEERGEDVPTEVSAEHQEMEPAIAETSTPSAAPVSPAQETAKEGQPAPQSFGPVRPPVVPLRP